MGSTTAANLGSTGAANDLTYVAPCTLGGVSPYDPLDTYVSFANGGKAANTNGQNLVQADNQSVEFWVKLSVDSPDMERLISTADNLFSGALASGFDVYAQGTVADGFHLGLSFIGFVNKTYSTTVAADTWTHVVVTETNGTWNMYVDDVLDSTTAIRHLVVPQTGFALGRNVRWQLGNLWMTGALDEVSWYDYVLSPEQISAHYEAGTAVPEPSGVLVLCAGIPALLTLRRRMHR